MPPVDGCRPVVRLETERLLLREFRDDDFEAYAAMCADAEVMRFLSADGAPLSREDAWRQMAMFAGHWALRGYGMWALEERGTGRFVGRAGLHYPEGWPEREVGWTLLSDQWGRGFAGEAARAAIDHAFGTLGWTRLVSVIHPANLRSIALARRLGETFSHRCKVRGAMVDVYSLERRDWRPPSSGTGGFHGLR
jgi:RimJ/RimL family protein N-acetyltransferase